MRTISALRPFQLVAMNKRLVARLIVAAGLASACTSANAADFSVFAFPNFSGGIPCGSGGSASSNSPIGREGICSGPGGFNAGSASASFGHVGARAEAVHLGSLSSPAGWNSRATFSDNIIFTSIDPLATFAEIAVNLAFSGTLAASSLASASSLIDATVTTGGRNFFYSAISGGDSQGVQRNDFAIVTGNVEGASIAAGLRSPRVTVALNSPSFFVLQLGVSAGANFGNGASALADFSNSWELPLGSDVFVLPPGVTANAGTWLVNNRRIDPNATAVPEPATWAMFIGGFGLVGGAMRRTRHARTVPT